jgi:hypothetical protein
MMQRNHWDLHLVCGVHLVLLSCGFYAASVLLSHGFCPFFVRCMAACRASVT